MQKFLDGTRAELSALEPKLVEYLLTPNEPTNDILRHIFAAGGKRVRPGLFLMVARLIGYTGPHLMPIAAVCEYIHTASLLHDDVIDNSTLRRGKPTANSIWGDESAVLAGDLIYSAACRLMVKTRSLELIDTFAECIRFMSESELFQLELLWKADVTREQYERVVHGKTAILFEASCKTPAFLAELPEPCSAALGSYGKHLGYVFQFADDVLDYAGTAEAVGKAVGADLRAGKITLPVLCALEREKLSKEKPVSEIVSNTLNEGTCSDAELFTLLQNIRAHGDIESALRIGQQHVAAAQQALKTAYEMLPSQESDASKNTLEILMTLPEALLHRSH
jgi:octaprenyl-diphosphate synthase